MFSSPFPNIPALIHLTCSKYFVSLPTWLNVSYGVESFPMHPRITTQYLFNVYVVICLLFPMCVKGSYAFEYLHKQIKPSSKKVKQINCNQAKSIKLEQYQSKSNLYPEPPLGLRSAGTLRTSGTFLGFIFRAIPRQKTWCK